MCDADVGVLNYYWVKRRKTPWANFNTWHKCRNWDNVMQWAEDHSAPRTGEKIERPSDVEGLDPPP